VIHENVSVNVLCNNFCKPWPILKMNFEYYTSKLFHLAVHVYARCHKKLENNEQQALKCGHKILAKVYRPSLCLKCQPSVLTGCHWSVLSFTAWNFIFLCYQLSDVFMTLLVRRCKIISKQMTVCCYTFTSSYGSAKIITRSPATAGIANRPLLFLEHRIPMPELFTFRRFTRVLEAGKYGCPY